MSAHRVRVGWLTAVLSATTLAFGVLSLSAPKTRLTPPPIAQTPPPDPTAPPPTTAAPSAADEAPPVPAQPPHKLLPPVIHAKSAILIDAVSGQVLYERNADVERPMASTTKIMTALLFCENVKDTDIITASENACSTTGSSLHLKRGEKISGSDMLHAILMRSANDGCVAAAEHIAGTEEAFVAKMNQRARELGALHTHFANSHGLNDDDHYTTARDLATIARAALADPRISAVVRTQYYRIHRSIDQQDVHLRNHSHFLGKFAGADGVKTGWTVPAGHYYVGSVTQHGWRLISVVLHSPDYVGETCRLMKFGFSNFAPHLLVNAGASLGVCPVQGGIHADVPVSVHNPVQIVTRKDDAGTLETRLHLMPVSAPVAINQPVGTLEVYRNLKQVGQYPLVALESDPLVPAALPLPKGGPWKSAALVTTIFAMGLVSLRYGTRFAAFTKSARRRRSGLTKSLRGDNRLR